MKKLPKKTTKDNVPFEPEDILTLLKQLVLSSLSAADYRIALKAIELWGKELGLFSNHKNMPSEKQLSDLSTKELEKFLDDHT